MRKIDWHLKVLLAISIPLVIVYFVFNLIIPFYQGIILNQDILWGDLKVYQRAVHNLFTNPYALYSTPPEIGNSWFIYPPPSVIIFIPMYIFKYPVDIIIYRCLLQVMYILSIYLVFKSVNNGALLAGDKKQKTIIYIILLACMPIYLDQLIMNANTIVLFLACLFYYYLSKKKYFRSAFFFVYGILFKLYPAVLISTYLKERKKLKIALAIFAFLILIPIVLMPFLPFKLYTYYFFDYMPKFINLPQEISPSNLSVTNFIRHCFLPAEYLASWDNLPIEPWIRTLNTIFSALAFGGLTLYYYKKGEQIRFFIFASMLSLTTIVSITGWAAAYVLSTPILLFSLIISIGQSKYIKLFVTFSIIMFFIPKPTTNIIMYFSNKIPHIIQILFYFKWLFINIILILMNIYLIEKKKYGAYGKQLLDNLV